MRYDYYDELDLHHEHHYDVFDKYNDEHVAPMCEQTQYIDFGAMPDDIHTFTV